MIHAIINRNEAWRLQHSELSYRPTWWVAILDYCWWVQWSEFSKVQAIIYVCLACCSQFSCWHCQAGWYESADMQIIITSQVQVCLSFMGPKWSHLSDSNHYNHLWRVPSVKALARQWRQVIWQSDLLKPSHELGWQWRDNDGEVFSCQIYNNQVWVQLAMMSHWWRHIQASDLLQTSQELLWQWWDINGELFHLQIYSSIRSVMSSASKDKTLIWIIQPSDLL